MLPAGPPGTAVPALRGIYPSSMVTSMEGYVPSARGKHLAKKGFTCHRNNKMKMQYQ